jgi:S1-C subfamily serine protease
MTVLDWIIIAFTTLMALWGYSQGLVVGALSLAGFLAGAFLGSRIGPLILEEGSRSPYAPLFALVGAFLIGGVLATGLEVLGFHLRRRLGPALGVLDGIGGAVLIACAGLVLWWLAGAVALQTPGARELRGAIQRSQVMQALNETLPPSGPLLNALARFDPFPQIAGPSADVPAPNAAIARDPDVQNARRSVVRVLGTACGLGVSGSGWVAEGGIVVTNAHVVAGQDDTTVQLEGGGAHLDAEPVWYDPRNDVALLRVPAAEDVPALPLNVNARPGTSAAILGFPGNGPYRVEPGRLGRTQNIRTEDAYGRGPVERRITTLRGRVRSGNSGGPMVDGRGRVVTTIFAATLGNGQRSGLGVPDTIVQDALARASGPVGTGACAH